VEVISTLIEERYITRANGHRVPVVPVLTCDLKVQSSTVNLS
jgi:hypothetical protein